MGKTSAARALVALALASTLAAACQGQSAREIQGILLDVQGGDLITADTIALRDDTGRLYTFRVSGRTRKGSRS